MGVVLNIEELEKRFPQYLEENNTSVTDYKDCAKAYQEAENALENLVNAIEKATFLWAYKKGYEDGRKERDAS